MGALNLPSAADIERLTRRLRAVSHRLEGIEDGVDRLDRALAPSGVEARLAAIETQLDQLAEKVDRAHRRRRGSRPPLARGRPHRGDRQTGRGGQTGESRTRHAHRQSRQSGQSRAQPWRPLAGEPPRARQSLSAAQARQRRDRRRAHALGRREQVVILDAPAPAVLVEGVRDGEQAGDGDRLRRARARTAPPPPSRRPALRGRRRPGRARRRDRRSRRPRSAPRAPPARAPVSAPRRRGRARRCPARARCRRRRSPRTRSPALRAPSEGSSAPQVPTRIARRAPRAISSVSTIAAEGPPMPVAWIVSGSPSGAAPV